MPELNYSIALKAGYPQCVFNQAENRFEQTWVYVITQTGSTQGTEISHFEIELCPNHNVLRASKNGVEGPVDANGRVPAINVEIFNPPNENASCLFIAGQNVRVIKWDNLSNDEVAPQALGEFNFVLEGCYQTGTIRAAIKGGSEQSGGGCDIDLIPGPTCEVKPPCPPCPPGRGLFIEA